MIKKGTEIDNLIIYQKDYGKFNYENCNLKDPDERFELRLKYKFGFGLYARHDISIRSFNLVFIS